MLDCQTVCLHSEQAFCLPHSKPWSVSLMKVVHKLNMQGPVKGIFEIRSCCRDMMHILLGGLFPPQKCESHDVKILHLGKTITNFMASTLLIPS